MAWVGVITNAGAAALEESFGEEIVLTIDAVKVGTGYVDPSNMRQATSLNNQVGTGVLVSKMATTAGVKVTTSIVPLATGVTIKEVGVFGTIAGSSVMIALYQNSDGIIVPSSSEFPDYSYTVSAIWDIDNSDTLEIEIDPESLVSRAALDEAMAEKVDIYQGNSYSGKFLGINSSGNVTPTDAVTPSDMTEVKRGIAIIINGNKNTTTDVTVGDYVFVVNSTISGRPDGLYRSTSNISHGTAFTVTDLDVLSNGVANDITEQYNSVIANTVVHKTGAEDIGGAKTFTSDITVKHSTSRYKYAYFKNSAGNNVGVIRIDQGNATNITSSRFGFMEYSPKSTADTGNTGSCEVFYLPAATAGLEANTSYNILTTKSLVTPAQGGTGQSSLQATRNAMGLGNTTGALPPANGGTGQTSLQATRNAMGLGNTTGALPAANGGTGLTSLQATRNAMGLGNTTGALPVANGGTGQTTLALARNAMGLGNTTGALPVANGGTGATGASAARTNLGLGSLATKDTIIKVKDYTYNWTNLAASANLDITASNFGASTPSGYTPIAVSRASSGNSNVICCYFDSTATGSTTMLRLRNVGTATAGTSAQTARIAIAYALSDAIG